jgi:hypothetical protein
VPIFNRRYLEGKYLQATPLRVYTRGYRGDGIEIRLQETVAREPGVVNVRLEPPAEVRENLRKFLDEYLKHRAQGIWE